MKRLTNLLIVAFACCFMAYMSSCGSSDKKADKETEETTVETESEESEESEEEVSAVACDNDFDYDECVPNIDDAEELTVSVDSDEIDKKIDEFEEMVASFEKIAKDFAEGESDLYTLTQTTEKVQALQHDINTLYKDEMSSEQANRMSKIGLRLTTALTKATVGGKLTDEIMGGLQDLF